jgi:hypothetical protein
LLWLEQSGHNSGGIMPHIELLEPFYAGLRLRQNPSIGKTLSPK